MWHRMVVSAVIRFATVSIVIATSLPVPAEAKDFCLVLNAFSFVLESFSIPAKGKCKEFGGWIQNSGNKDMFTGTACTFSDGSQVRFGLQTSPVDNGSGGAFLDENYSIALDLPALTGTFIERFIFYSTVPTAGTDEGTATGGPCTPSKVPFP